MPPFDSRRVFYTDSGCKEPFAAFDACEPLGSYFSTRVPGLRCGELFTKREVYRVLDRVTRSIYGSTGAEPCTDAGTDVDGFTLEKVDPTELVGAEVHDETVADGLSVRVVTAEDGASQRVGDRAGRHGRALHADPLHRLAPALRRLEERLRLSRPLRQRPVRRRDDRPRRPGRHVPRTRARP